MSEEFDRVKSEFARGTIVRLISGGPSMTVADVYPDGVIETVWFDESASVHRDGFDYRELVLPRSGLRRIEQGTAQNAFNSGWAGQ
jgi:uncharacterized protein YodC (DUF2158 family)